MKCQRSVPLYNKASDTLFGVDPCFYRVEIILPSNQLLSVRSRQEIAWEGKTGILMNAEAHLTNKTTFAGGMGHATLIVNSTAAVSIILSAVNAANLTVVAPIINMAQDGCPFRISCRGDLEANIGGNGTALIQDSTTTSMLFSGTDVDVRVNGGVGCPGIAFANVSDTTTCSDTSDTVQIPAPTTTCVGRSGWIGVVCASGLTMDYIYPGGFPAPSAPPSRTPIRSAVPTPPPIASRVPTSPTTSTSRPPVTVTPISPATVQPSSRTSQVGMLGDPGAEWLVGIAL